MLHAAEPVSAAQFLQSLYGSLPGFFSDEDQLRQLWSAPDTRKALLAGLADQGFGRAALADMQALSDAFADLGQPDQVRQLFVGFQRHLYQRPAGPPG